MCLLDRTYSREQNNTESAEKERLSHFYNVTRERMLQKKGIGDKPQTTVINHCNSIHLITFYVNELP